MIVDFKQLHVRDHIPLQQGLRLKTNELGYNLPMSETIFHYNKD